MARITNIVRRRCHSNLDEGVDVEGVHRGEAAHDDEDLPTHVIGQVPMNIYSYYNYGHEHTRNKGI